MSPESKLPTVGRTPHAATHSLGGVAEPRLIRAPHGGEGVLLNERHLRLEDIDELVEELTRQSEGRLEDLRRTATEVESRLRQQADESRARIDRAMKLARDRIDEQLRETARRSCEILDQRHAEGYRDGHAGGYRTGYEEGLQRGLEAGLLEGRARGHDAARTATLAQLEEELGPARDALRALAAQLDRDWCAHFEQARAEIVQLALDAARAIVQDAARRVPETVLSALEAALTRLGSRRRVSVELHPEDRQVIDRYLCGEGARLLDGAAFDLIEDAALARGGCRVQCAETIVDATLETQQEIVREHLLVEGGGVSA